MRARWGRALRQMYDLAGAGAGRIGRGRNARPSPQWGEGGTQALNPQSYTRPSGGWDEEKNARPSPRPSPQWGEGVKEGRQPEKLHALTAPKGPNIPARGNAPGHVFVSRDQAL